MRKSKSKPSLETKFGEDVIDDLFRLKGKYLFHREGQQLEYKEQFNFAGLGEYLRDFAAFANNRGGFIVFGVKDNPHVPLGLSEKAKEQFAKLDPATISGHLLELFSPDIRWEQQTIEKFGKSFGAFYVHEAPIKPVIAKKDAGKDDVIKSGEIYYRYGGRTQKIQFSELENIINRRISQNNGIWMDLVSKIGRAGPQNIAVLDTERGLIERSDSGVLLLDDSLLNELKFIKDGGLSEKDDAPTLKVVGNVQPIKQVEVIKRVKEDILKDFPLTAKQVIDKVKQKLPDIKQNEIYDAIRDNELKASTDYSHYVFRNLAQNDQYEKNGTVPNGTTSIYKEAAVNFLVKALKKQT